jgi:two-component system NtrC family response regulator
MSRANILIIEDDVLQRELIKENLEGEQYSVFEADGSRDALRLLKNQQVDIAVVDFRLENETGLEATQKILSSNPLITVIMVTAYGNVETAVEAMKKGVYDFIPKPIDFDNFLLIISRALERQKLRREVRQLRRSLEQKFSKKNFIFQSSAMERVAHLMVKAAESEANVLISGETGTGKDLVARSIHYSSRRKEGPFLAVNIPSFPETLLESELFGSEKGAFTGAVERKTGKFEAADGGTLFLDEIGEMPLSSQVKLLRFLQDRNFFRLGSSKPTQSDVRIMAATNRDLEELMRKDRFRKDLYFRLNVVRIHVPPLRERKEDIPVLTDHFIRKYSRREQKDIEGISAEAMNQLMNYSFPGNIRELENIVERAVVFSEGNDLVRNDLPVFLEEKKESELFFSDLSLPEKIKQLETREIQRALHENAGIKARAARALGLTERMLSYKMKNYGIE